MKARCALSVVSLIMASAISAWVLSSFSFAADFKPRELLTNGNFESGDKAPKDWTIGPGVSWEKEDGNHFLRLRVTKPGGSATSSRNLRLEPDWGFLRVPCRVRYRDIVRGVEGWHDGRIAMTFKDAKGQRVGEWPNVLHWTGTSNGWQQESRDYFIPEGAASVDISMALFSVPSGEIDFDDVSVMVIRPRPQLEDAARPADADGKLWEANTATRGKMCLNGYWRFRPIGLGDDVAQLKPDMLKTPPPVPKSPGWGWLKVPSCWPKSGREGHNVVAPDIWESKVNWNKVEAVWYQREMTIPATWAGRRVCLDFDMPQTQASVFVDGKTVGAVRWPAGRLDLTDVVKPGQKATLTIFLTALPFEAEKLVAMREDMIFKAKSEIRFRGLCGDIFLEGEPSGPRIASVQFRPSTRKKQLGMHMEFLNLSPDENYTITVEPIFGNETETTWTSPPFKAHDAQLTMPWLANRLWDLDQPNLYDVRLQLRQAGKDSVLDERGERMGFREVWLEGRSIMLNGTPVHWRALDFSNHTSNAGAASYLACRETFRRMRALGFNFAILANYGFDPGETMTFEDLLRAADETGFLLSFSAPHPLRSIAGYDMKRGLSEEWRAAADYCVRRAQNHPSVLAYAMSHNTLGYSGDQNPAKMDGKHNPMPTDEKARKGFIEKREVAAAAEAYVRGLDPTRLVYHHQSGNMGDWHTVNIYLCWAPMQERTEWLSHWAKEGVKPLFFVEWGLPHIASWGGHRLGPFIWRNKVNSEPLAIEFGAAITGDAAYSLTEDEEKHIDNYERVYARGTPFHISEVLGDYWGTAREHNMVEIQSEFTRHVWPAFRTWGLSAVLPWDQGNIARKAGETGEQVNVVWKPNQITGPGIHPDFIPNKGDGFQFGDLSALELSSLGRTFERVNADFLAYIAGSEKRFTEQGHIFHPGERVSKQIVIINDRRTAVTGHFEWSASLAPPEVGKGHGKFNIAPGQSKLWPVTFTIPSGRIGGGMIRLTVYPDGSKALQDEFAFTVLEKPAAVEAEIPIFDPAGKTSADLKRLGMHAREMSTNAGAIHEPRTELVRGELPLLIIGRQALTTTGEFPDIAPILAKGGTVLVMEQDEEILSKRLGFRTNVASLRSVFCRLPDNPPTFSALMGLSNDLMHDWRGEATLIPAQYDLPQWEETYPMVDWLGFRNSRAWKWGSQGQVASVVIEKPQRGDFLPILDGGFDEKYAPLLAARVGAGRIIFCQMDVSGRTEPDPAADALLSYLVRDAQTSPPPAQNVKAWCGDDSTKKLLAGLGAVLATSDKPQPSDVLVAGRDQKDVAVLRRHTQAGGTVVMLDCGAEALKAVLPEGASIEEKKLTHTARPIGRSPAWRGVGPSDLHWRGRTTVNTVLLPKSVGEMVSTDVLAAARVGKGRVITCAVTPERFDYTAPNKIYLKPTRAHTAFLVSRLLANQNVGFATGLMENWSRPVMANQPLTAGWLGRTDPKEALTPEIVSAPDFDTKEWKPIAVPGEWEKQSPEWASYDGIFWYRLVLDVPEPLTKEESQLALGPVDDEDWTYLNGKLLGHIGQDTNPDDYWSAPRMYSLSAGALKAGKNVLVVKVRDLRQSGGIMTSPVEIRLPSRWLKSYYLDEPAMLDDPYRYNRW